MSEYSASDNEAADKEDTETRQSRSTSESILLGSSSSKSNTQPYTILDYYELTLPLINGKCLQSLNVHSFLRTLLDFLLLHSFLLKALQKREIKLADLTLHEFEGGMKSLLIKSILPKTTQVQYTARLRHKLVELCPIFILSIYIFARFHIPDTYGEYDLTDESLTNEQFLEYKLLNGGNKLRPLSYSQQYKASTKILKLSDKFKPIHLGKILTTRCNTDPKLGLVSDNFSNLKCLSHNVENIDVEVLSNFAGFENSKTYLIERADREPPAEIVQRIFPFLNSHEYGKNPEFDKLFRLLDFLRHTLVQDMVEIKKRFPENLICEHPMFSSQEFCDFAGVTREKPENYSRQALDTDPESSSNSTDESDGLDENYSREGEDRHQNFRKRRALRALPVEDKQRLKHLESLVEKMKKLQEAMAKEMNHFIETQSEQLADQSNTLKKLMNSTEGLAILLATRNPNSNTYTKQVLDRNSMQLNQLNRHLAQSGNDGLNILMKWNLRMRQIGLHSNQILDQHESLRHKALASTPLPEVRSIDELVNDFALWHRSLVENNISLDEWAAAHNAADRSLVESRTTIVNFIEREAANRQIPIQVLITKLQDRLKDQDFSQALSDLSKQLLAGGRVIID